jgi:hypothetical protein
MASGNEGIKSQPEKEKKDNSQLKKGTKKKGQKKRFVWNKP